MISKNRLKYLVSLKQKKYRQKYGHFLVEGEKSVLELLHSDFNVNEIIADGKWLAENGEKFSNFSIEEVEPEQLAKISYFSSPSPICAVAEIKANEKDIHPGKGWTIALDGIKDPGNLGTIIRTADWYGIEKVFCSSDCVEFYNPKVISSTMGSFTRLQPQYGDLTEFLAKSKNVMACVLGGRNIRTVEHKTSGVILIGSESHGISEDILKLEHINKVTIPGAGSAESLNAGIATAIACERLIPSVDQN